MGDDGVMLGKRIYQPNGPVSLNEEQILALHERLREMRHEVNNKLNNIGAAAELMQMKPETAMERLPFLHDQVKIAATSIAEFSRTFESVMGLNVK